MTPLQRVASALETHGCRPRPHGRGYRARCPVHEDSTPSLDVREGRVRPVVLLCRAGCETDAILDALGLTWRELNDERKGWV